MNTQHIAAKTANNRQSLAESGRLRGAAILLASALVVGGLLSAPLFLPPYSVVLLITILMYVVLAVSWSAFCGTTQYFSLGIAAFFGVGIYVTALLSKAWPWAPLPLLILLGGTASFCLAVLVGLSTLRIKGMYFAIFTFGLSELLRHSVMWWEVNKTGTVGRWIAPADNVVIYRYMVIIAATTVLGAYFVRRSRYGLALRSIGDNEIAAEHMGVNATIIKIVAFGASCFMTGAAGALVGARWTYVDADVAFDPIRTVYTIMMSLFGGMDVLYGPIIGAVAIGWVSDVVLADFARVSRLLLGLILVIVVLFLPNGLADLVAARRWTVLKEKLRSNFQRIPSRKPQED